MFLVFISFVPKDHFELLSQDPNAFEYLYAQVNTFKWPFCCGENIFPELNIVEAIKGQMNQNFDIFYFRSILVKYV